MNPITSAAIRALCQVLGSSLVMFGYMDQDRADALVANLVMAIGALIALIGVAATFYVAVKRYGLTVAIEKMLGLEETGKMSKDLVIDIANKVNDPAATAVAPPEVLK